jgi:3-oxoacyl-[acyl-carrier-protein] synthase-3
MAISGAMWRDAQAEFDWSDMDRYVAHQVSQVFTAAMCRTLDIDSARVPRSFPTRGNMGPASIPFTLATQVDTLQTGDRVMLMGVGSGLNGCCAEVVW